MASEYGHGYGSGTAAPSRLGTFSQEKTASEVSLSLTDKLATFADQSERLYFLAFDLAMRLGSIQPVSPPTPKDQAPVNNHIVSHTATLERRLNELGEILNRMANHVG